MSGSDHWVTSCGFALCRLAGAILSTYRNFLSYWSLKGCPWLPLKFKLLYFLTHTTFLFVSAPACPCYMPRLSSWQLLSFLSFLRPAVLEKIAKLVCGLVKLTLYKEVFILYFNKYSLPTKSGIPLELHLVGRFLQRKRTLVGEVVEDNTVTELQWFRIPTFHKSCTAAMDFMSSYQSNYFSWTIEVFIKMTKPVKVTVILHALLHFCFVLLPAWE